MLTVLLNKLLVIPYSKITVYQASHLCGYGRLRDESGTVTKDFLRQTFIKCYQVNKLIVTISN